MQLQEHVLHNRCHQGSELIRGKLDKQFSCLFSFHIDIFKITVYKTTANLFIFLLNIKWMRIIYSNWLVNKERKKLISECFVLQETILTETVIYTTLIMKILTINIIHKVIGGSFPFIIERHIFDVSIYHWIMHAFTPFLSLKIF